MNRTQILVLLVAITLSNAASIYGATTHKHVTHTSKERLKDGVYSPKDAHHHKDGEHHVEFDHEAIIGNIKEAQEYDTLTPEESKKRLAILVKMMDSNKDQFVDRHELGSWILRSFNKLAEEEATDRFDEIDADSDEHVTWKEYMLDVYSMEDETFRKELIEFDSYEEEHKMIRDDKAMFELADFDRDGALDMDEFLMFQNPEEHPRMIPLVLEQSMRDKDKNKDGHIDFTEFIGDSAKHHDQEWLVTEKERFDKDYDLNEDGVLKGDEVLEWIVPQNADIVENEVDHLFATADEDHDDRLSYAEIIQNYETFVGSEATDYGDHLQNIKRLEDEL